MTRPAPTHLRDLRRRDPRLAAAMDRLPKFPGFPDEERAREANHWHALARAIVFQQLATAAATTIHRRVCALTPGEGLAEPAEFLRIDAAALRGAGLSANKLEALRDLATRIHDGRLPLHDLHETADDEVIARLVAVRGIGEWSAHMFLLFRLGRLDVGASGDLGVREGLRLLDELDERPTPKVALARMEAWRPLRSVGCWLMWRLVDAQRAAAAAEAPPMERKATKTSATESRATNTRSEALRAMKSSAAKSRAASSSAVKSSAASSSATQRSPKKRSPKEHAAKKTASKRVPQSSTRGAPAPRRRGAS